MTNYMVLGVPTIEDVGGKTRCSVEFTVGGDTHRLFVQTEKHPVGIEEAQDAFLCSVLVPAMRSGGHLQVLGPVSTKLLQGIGEIQSIMKMWYPRLLSRISIEAESRDHVPGLKAFRAGQFFSAGVDSFYTLLENSEEITELFYVRGFDLFLSQRESLQTATRNAEKAANKFGKNLVVIETNLHEFSAQFVKWPNHYHGSAMATMAHIMAGTHSRVYFASTHSYADLFPWGSHVLVDGLWSSESLQIRHHGADASRLEKVFRLAETPECIPYLNWGCGGQGCSRSEKCLRTLIALDLAGVRHLTRPEIHALEPYDVENLEIRGQNGYSFELENYRELLVRQDKADLRRALRIAIQNYQNRKIASNIEKNMGSLPKSPHFLRIIELLQPFFPITPQPRDTDGHS